MMSTLFFSEISTQIAQAKGWKPDAQQIPFGGVNVILFGDFGQLRPIHVLLLFLHKLVSKINSNQGQMVKGQNALYSTFI